MADASDEFEQQVQQEMHRLQKLDELTTKPMLDELPDTPFKPLLEFLISGDESTNQRRNE